MIICATIEEFHHNWVPGGVLVPTMGALHEGHLSLVRKGLETGEPVAVSVFVNPTQFGPNEDFKRYPRNLERDADLLSQAGATVLFAPAIEEVYPEQGSKICVPGVTELYEGALRPGHFDGVATIVCKLFNICRPNIAIFGLKDLQQCAVIKQMTRDLNIPVKLLFAETHRESNGLAMSSRNEYLSSETRNLAAEIYKQLTLSKRMIQEGHAVDQVLDQAKSDLKSSGFKVDYFDQIDVDRFKPSNKIGPRNAIIAAVKAETTRLIDNILLFPSSDMS